MSEVLFRFDEIGFWSELKLEIIEKYGAAYTRAFINQPFLKKYYIDGFSGAGLHLSKETKEAVEGSAVRALRVSPPFDGFYFVDMNPDKTAFLSKLCEGREYTHIYTGDSNDVLTEEVFPKIQFEKYTRALCLLDPYGLHLNWDLLRQAGQSRAIDMFLNFPVMDMNRNAIWKNPEKATAAGIERMTRFWGDESWRQAAYAENPQGNLFGNAGVIKQDNETIVDAFRKRLREVAGFEFVPKPLPMKNSNNAVVYYLFFAARNKTANKIVEDIFARYR